MKCPNCEEDVKETWKVCPNCHADLTLRKYSKDKDPITQIQKDLDILKKREEERYANEQNTDPKPKRKTLFGD